jgi:hypothetical protein
MRYLCLVTLILAWIGVVSEHRLSTWVTAVCWTLYAAVWWFALDTVVDDSGVRIAGGRFRQRIDWHQVKRFAVDPSTHKPLVVLANGERKRLVYVPDSAWEGIQLRWQRATGREISTAAETPDAGS